MKINLFWSFLLWSVSLTIVPLAGGGIPDHAESGQKTVVEAQAQLALVPSSSSMRSATAVPSQNNSADTRGGDLIEGGLAISSPENGRTVSAGSIVTITVEPVAPFEAQRVMLQSKLGVRVLEHSPFEFELAVPDDHLGTVELSATGEDGSGNFATTDSVFIVVEAPSELVALDVSPDEVYLNGVDDRRRLRVTGEYADGISRALSDPSAGTVFTSNDPAIVTVSDDGILRPRGNGVTTVIASNGGLNASMRVEVLRIGESR